MKEMAEAEGVELASGESGESSDRAQAGWISGIQWGPWQGLDMATRLPLPAAPGTVLRGLPLPPQTLIV